MILCGGIQLSLGEKINCHFRDEDYYLGGILYTCEVTLLDNTFNNITFDGFTGVHITKLKLLWNTFGNLITVLNFSWC